jgi:hypothetical protein
LVAPVIPVETGVFSSVAPDEYAVLIPVTDSFTLFADGRPLAEVSEVRISLFCKGNLTARARQITALLLEADFTVTGRWYQGREEDTGYHHLSIDVAKEYETEV